MTGRLRLVGLVLLVLAGLAGMHALSSPSGMSAAAVYAGSHHDPGPSHHDPEPAMAHHVGATCEAPALPAPLALPELVPDIRPAVASQPNLGMAIALDAVDGTGCGPPDLSELSILRI